jgi:2-keto-4-pentenoate hydratase/2-oxohepta-3-ene-1,7-dioic acid hydratase in catechol pathway
LVTFAVRQSAAPGVVTDRGIVNISSAWDDPEPPRSVAEILARGAPCLQRVRELAGAAEQVIPLDFVRLLAPIPRPGKVLALAGNYSEHIREASVHHGYKLGLSDSPRQTTTPRPFLMPSTAVIGPGETIPWPAYTREVDYELELAIVIGRIARHVDANDALDYVAGYAIANDVSARSVTFTAGRAQRPWDEFYDWLNGKWADGFCPMGPCLVTSDEVANVQDLKMTLKVNRQVRQDADTAQMIYPVADIVSFLSHLMTLEPGDVICTGTPSGVGVATGDFLEAGDRIECTIDGLGTLTNTVGPQPAQCYQPLTRPASQKGPDPFFGES